MKRKLPLLFNGKIGDLNMDKKYYYNIIHRKENHAGTKAVDDCNNILKSIGYEPIDLVMKEKNNTILRGVERYFYNFRNFFKKYNTSIVIQHPLRLRKIYIDMLGIAKIIRRLEYIFLIHDLDSLRYENGSYIDNKMLKIADYIISHNEKMTNYLIENGVPEEKIVNLEIFDYLGDIKKKNIRFAPVLNIAGNLDSSKCKYLEDLNLINNGTLFNLYGINFDEKVLASGTISYKGAFKPEEILNQLKEGFGLVWDGTSINACEGNTGEYLKYNNPHKLSLYLASGLPVVISEEAAEADYVKEHNVGIVVKRIEDFKKYFDKLTLEEYNTMLECVNECSQKINEGYYLKKAIMNVEKKRKYQ